MAEISNQARIIYKRYPKVSRVNGATPVRLTYLLAFVSIGILNTARLRAQDYKFEVASIRPAGEHGDSTYIKADQGGMRTSGTSLLELIRYAYRAQFYQITAATGWIRDARFDISAKHDQGEEGDVPPEDPARQARKDERIRVRLRHLLAERFQLKLREEMKDLPIYVLKVDKGHKMKSVAAATGRINVNNSNGKLRGEAVTMQRLTQSLTGMLGRPVRDETELMGWFDLELNWSSDATAGATSPGFFTALREQLGLKLESRKGPVATYAIERAEKPSEN